MFEGDSERIEALATMRRAMPAHDEDPAARPIELGRFYCCVLREKILERARLGDRWALERCLSFVPDDLPPSIRTAARDEEIRAIAAELRAERSELSGREVARLLDRLGRRAEMGHSTLPAGEFPWLTAAEGRDLVARVKAVIAYQPKWPRERQLFDIVR
jgi:hypothetical protein